MRLPRTTEVATGLVSLGLLSLLLTGCSSAGASAAGSPSEPASARSSPTKVALTETYTSAEHHFQISYPDGWHVKAATKPWKYGNWEPTQAGIADVLRAPDGSGWNITSQVMPARLSDQQWLQQYTAPNPGSPNACFPRYSGYQRIVVDGHPGGVHGGVSPCNFTEAVVIAGNRAYQITASPALDFASSAVYNRALFNQILATVRLLPTGAN